jgi:CO/xanthine dehydrogenase Mo-binding subunit
VVTITTGFDASGKIQARHSVSVYNSGAYAAFKPAPDATLPRVLIGGVGAYAEIPVWRVEGHMVYTNTVPCGHMRAPGGAQPIHAMERHLDLCARAMGIDPLELRIRNAPNRQRETRGGEPGTRPQAREALEAAGKAIGWTSPRPDGVGRGIALVDTTNSPADAYSALLSVERSGEVVFHTPMIEQGSGMLTVFRQMVAEQLGLPETQVRVEQTMEGIEYDRGVGGSRVTRVVGRVIDLLAEQVRARLSDLLAAEFGYEASQITVEPGGFRTPDGRVHTLAEAASLSPRGITELLRYDLDRYDVIDTYGAVAAEVRVDAETGAVQVERVVTALEVGRVLNPVMHQGQIDGGLIQGLGFALMENLALEEGRVTTANLNDYKLPTARDIPALTTILLKPDLSLGITPIGEGPNAAISAAIANAIADATAADLLELPIIPESIAYPGPPD